ncbi:unnamed protein product [Thelazia callipaeda]|uniref:Phosphatidylinositol glycan, class U n=1 Tax=Thelazia callipaeda TaxID=103827 RepID=A0A0N5D3Z9_THECL|nr:unnamed protein product [Thelazia callipaeda]
MIWIFEYVVPKHYGLGDDVLAYALGVLLRVLAFFYCIDFLKKRPELNVPQNSFRRLVDGVNMLRDGFSPYSGDMPPVILSLFSAVIDHPLFLLGFFVIIDVVTSEILYMIAMVHLKNQKNDAKDVKQIANFVYILNPISIATCAVFSLSVIYNLITALLILAFVNGCLLFSTIFCSILIHFSLYPVIYLCALLVRFSKLQQRLLIFIFSIISLTSLMFLNYYLNGRSWDYVDSTLDVRDLTPNVGIFWYFFIEVFDHFRCFFLWVFQVNIFVYLIPLSLTLRSSAFLLLHQLMILTSVFSSYPTMADNFRWGLIIGGALSTTMVLAPVMWQMWVITGSGNANFYFAATLIYSVAQILLLTDLLYAHLRLKVTTERGIVDENKVATLVLK